MDFVSLRIENFLSYQKAEFTDFAKPGLTLIEGQNLDEGGSNGSGKSTPWDALSWCLFGQTVRGLKNDEVIHRGVGKDCLVSVVFEHSGKKWRIERFRKHFDFGNRLLPIVDGALLELGTVAHTQEFIEQSLGIDFELFRCTIVFAQGETFNFVNETNKKQKEILSKVMKIDFSSNLVQVKKAIKAHGSEVDEVEEKVTVLRSHQRDADKLYKDEIELWEAERKEKLRDLVNDLGTEEGENKELKGRLRSLELIEKVEAKVSDAQKSLNAKIVLLSHKETKLSVAYSYLQKELAGILKFKGGEATCPTCSQMVDLEHVKEHAKALKLKSEDTLEVKNKVARAVKVLQDQYDKYDEKKLAISKKQREQDRLHHEYDTLQKSIASLKSGIKELKGAKNPYHGLIEEEKEKQKRIEAKLKELEKRLEEIGDDKSYLEFWEEAFGDSGIKSFVFDLICSTLTQKANYYANMMTNGQVVIEFDTQKKLKTGELRDKFDVSLLTGGDKVRYEAYSGGEKRKISLAVDMALSDIMADYYGSTFNVVVFDEQTNYLDKNGRESFLRLLKEIAKTKRVLVVDHDAEFKGRFDTIWTVEKRDGVSRLL